jgi:hypothetical protein
MKNLTKSAIVATVMGFMAASASASSNLVPTSNFRDLSPAAQKITDQNIAALGVKQRKGDTITIDEQIAIQLIVMDRGSFASKAKRIDLIVNGDSRNRGPGLTADF